LGITNVGEFISYILMGGIDFSQPVGFYYLLLIIEFRKLGSIIICLSSWPISAVGFFTTKGLSQALADFIFCMNRFAWLQSDCYVDYIGTTFGGA
jgi:hypothetical protein